MNRAFQQVYGLTAQPLEEKDFDQEALETLYRQFSSRDWVYGATFPFDFSCTEKFPWGEVSIRLRVEQGICRQAAVYTDAMDAHLFDVLTRKLEAAPSPARRCAARRSLRACQRTWPGISAA